MPFEGRNAPKQTLSTSQGPWRRCQRAEPWAGSPVQMERRVAGSYPLYPMVEVLREFPEGGKWSSRCRGRGDSTILTHVISGRVLRQPPAFGRCPRRDERSSAMDAHSRRYESCSSTARRTIENDTHARSGARVLHFTRRSGGRRMPALGRVADGGGRCRRVRPRALERTVTGAIDSSSQHMFIRDAPPAIRTTAAVGVKV